MPKAPPKVGAKRAKRAAWAGHTASKRKFKGRSLQRERTRHSQRSLSVDSADRKAA